MRRMLLAVGLVVLGLVLTGSPRPVTAADATGPVLDETSSWRQFYTWRSPVRLADEGAERIHERGWSHIAPTPAPDVGWAEPSFDDSGWARREGPFYGGHGHGDGDTLAMINLRGRFKVRNPEAVESLTLELAYRGGAAVYLNGHEITRRHLPGGELGPEVLAEAYPLSAWQTPKGGELNRWNVSDHASHAREQRVRRLAVKVPTELLREGTNVLGVQIHRSPMRTGTGRTTEWLTCGFDSLTLAAALQGAIEPNTGQPERVQVWNADPLAAIGRDLSFGDPLEPLRPVRLIGPRNGVASGQLVISGRRTLPQVRAEVSDLNGPGGAVIGAEAIELRYATRQTPQQHGPAPYFDALLDESLGETAIQPVWLTATIPADVESGTYEGTLTITGLDEPAEAPVRLEVGRWQIPDPQDWVSWASFWHSAEAVAYQYDVELWSPRHMQKLAGSLKLMGQAGNNIVYINAIRNTLQSERAPMIVFECQGDALVPDLTPMQRYLDAYQEHAGEPRAVVLYLWEHWMHRRCERAEAIPVLVREENGQLVEAEMSMFGDEGSEAVWSAVIEGVRGDLQRRGWEQTELMLGVGHDALPDDRTFDLFDQIAPDLGWAVFSHWRGVSAPQADGTWVIVDRMRIACGEHPGSMGPGRPRQLAREHHAADAAEPLRLLGGWDLPFRRLGTFRQWVIEHSPLRQYRSMPEGTVGERDSGFGRMGLDYWPVPLPDGGRNLPWAHGGWNNLYRGNPRAIAAPGPHGAVATVRYEMLREGIQEAEARIFIERALADERTHAMLGEDLANRCLALLVQRLTVRYPESGRNWHMGAGWKQRSLELFNLAGEVAEALDD